MPEGGNRIETFCPSLSQTKKLRVICSYFPLLVWRFDESHTKLEARCPDLDDCLMRSAASITEAAVRAPAQPGRWLSL